MINNLVKFSIYIWLVILGLICGIWINDNKNWEGNNEKINSILKLIEENYVDSVNINDIYEDMINDMLLDLDPHSSYINAEKFTSIQEDMQGSFSGIGVQFNIINDSIVVIAAISGGPSEKLGIIAGDRIVYIEQEEVVNINIRNEEVIKKLRGAKGTPVNVKIYRRGYKELIEYRIIRDDIPLLSVDASIMLNNNIGYIKINRFAATTYNEFDSGVQNLINNGMEKLILDLRNNPGGYLGVAIQMCDAILEADQLIVYTQGNKRKREDIYSTSYGSLKKNKIIVLIDEGSASASEIVAGAIQDNDRGLIIGRKSFGKGLVQEQRILEDKSVVRLTTQRYYTPSGRCIQKPYKKNTNNIIEKTTDTLIYKTSKGKTVYAGGGITPDIIIERDSNLNFLKINRLISKGIINEFCLKESLLIKKGEPNISPEIFLTNKNENKIYRSFLEFLHLKEYIDDLTIIGKVELEYLQNLLKATIARNMWDDKIYFTIRAEEDEFIKKAMQEFKY